MKVVELRVVVDDETDVSDLFDNLMVRQSVYGVAELRSDGFGRLVYHNGYMRKPSNKVHRMLIRGTP